MELCAKRSYPSEHSAKKAADIIERHGKRLRAYRCPTCHNFHLTSDVERKHRVPWYGKNKMKNLR